MSPVSRQKPGILLARGVCRSLQDLGYVTLTEFTLPDDRRADVMALTMEGDVTIIEVKSSVQDFRTDQKWAYYRDYCDAFYFAIPEDFPQALIPGECGLIIADAFEAAILRPAPQHRLAPARRRALTLRFARLAAQRLQFCADAGSGRLLGPLGPA